MKICIISTLFRPLSRGGAELVAERVADGLVAQGHEVVVISLNTYRPWNIASFQNLAKLPAFMRLLWHVLDMFNLHTFFVVRNILKKEKPDLVLSHNIKGLGYTVPRAVACCHIPYAHTLHDVQLVEPSGILSPTSPLQGEGVGEVYSWITRTLFGSPTVVISPSKFLMDFYTTRGFFKNSKKLILHNPIQHMDSGFSSKNKTAEAERAWGSAEGRTSEAEPLRPAATLEPPSLVVREENPESMLLQLLYVSQLHPSRGILFLVDTLKKWEQPFHLTIVGTGACEAQLREQLKHDTRFTLCGYIANNKLALLYQEADALVLPSLCVENAPLTITDALAHGVPVIASRVGGIPEMIQEGVNGFTFEPGNTHDLLEKLSKIKNLQPQTTQLPTIEKYLQTLLYAAK